MRDANTAQALPAKADDWRNQPVVPSKNFLKELIKDSSEDKTVLRELFSKNDIEVRTELMSIEEAGLFAKYIWLSNMDFCKDTKLNDLLIKQLELRLSHKRKSRREFLEGFKTNDIGQPMKRGFFERLGFG